MYGVIRSGETGWAKSVFFHDERIPKLTLPSLANFRPHLEFIRDRVSSASLGKCRRRMTPCCSTKKAARLIIARIEMEGVPENAETPCANSNQIREKQVMLMFVGSLLMCLMNDSPVQAKTVEYEQIEYKLLATNKTSTMEKEMNQAAGEGFRFEGNMGGETAGGGNEIVVIMSRRPSTQSDRLQYKLLATKKTSTMSKELNEAGGQGFSYVGQTIYDSAFGGREVVVILERNDKQKTIYEYRLQATNRTSTQQKELNEAGREGFQFCGITVAETSFGGREVVSILRRAK
ncbi:MAG: hypothetical protein AB7P14_01680 [Blastocatellales bacterium]